MKQSRPGTKSFKFKKELTMLKDKLISCEDFSEIHNMFFDLLAENHDFLRLSKKAKHPVLKQAAAAIGKKLLQKEVEISLFMLLKYKKYNFYHGTCFIDGHIAGIFFFQDIDMGMMSLSVNPPYTSFMRFTSIIVDKDDDQTPPLSIGRSKAIH
ncbi:hypothetical protein QUF76_08480 [Desulfobacterales bacterium HSG16]|nr:hypothetical protein [Desulfobacterales bacterium HSG16]